MREPQELNGTDRPCQYPKISPAPSWTSVFTKTPELEAPGYAEAFIESFDTSQHYGWAVMTSRGLGVIKVTNWEKAKQKEPYQWLNTHPKQPASVEETLELAKETLKAHNEKQKHRKEVL